MISDAEEQQTEGMDIGTAVEAEESEWTTVDTKKKKKKGKPAENGDEQVASEQQQQQRNVQILLQSKDDYYRILSLAVDYDASFFQEHLLECPLETGRIYGHSLRRRRKDTNDGDNNNNNNNNNDNNNDFLSIVQFLFRWKKRRPLWQVLWSMYKTGPATKALTPSILSGLVSLLENPSALILSTASGEIKVPQQKVPLTSSELVLFCQGLRQAALQQIRAKERQRRFLFFFVVPCVLSLSCLLLLSRMSYKVEREMIQLGLLSRNTCNSISKQSTQQTCHLTDSAVFSILYDKDPILQGSQACLQEPTENIIHGSASCIQDPSQYAMHLILKNDTISLDQVVRGTVRPTSTTQKANIQQQATTKETVVNRLIRQAIIDHSDMYADNKHENVLDIGCGLSSTLYSLIPLVTESNHQQSSRQRSLSSSSWRQSNKKTQPFHYKGISLGMTEVQNARRLAEHFLQNIENLKLSFVAGNFDDVNQRAELFRSNIGSPFSTLVAVESLSYSDNLSSLLASCYKALPKGGLLILVDDVLLGNAAAISSNNNNNANLVALPEARVRLFQTALLRPSLLDHTAWMNLLSKTGFQVLESRDLTVEYELLEDFEDHSLPMAGSGDSLLSGVALNTASLILDIYDNSMLKILMRFVRAKGDDSKGWIQQISAWLRLLLLRRGTGAAKRLHALRKRAYRDSELRYNLYICKKI